MQEYYSEFMELWNECSSLVQFIILATALVGIQNVHVTSKGHQFLMRLRKKFEPVRISLMNRVPSMEHNLYKTESLQKTTCKLVLPKIPLYISLFKSFKKGIHVIVYYNFYDKYRVLPPGRYKTFRANSKIIRTTKQQQL